LTRDHKPDDKYEAEVIISHGGRIDSYRDHQGNALGPLRVWLKHEDIPGLAMTRSFGDAMAAKVGVTAIPECGEFDLTPNDKFIVLASDGIWEFLKNIDVAKIIFPFYLKKNAEGAAECLVREAFKKWKKEEDSIDDITCIVIFLDVK
jgi:serine/threonine protein phosphatase PrpC